MIAASAITDPFPGLRPFKPEEAQLFFGRDEEIEGLLQRLSTRRFLAVVGTSGSGKSSLVRAGLIPTIERGHLGPTGSRFVVATVSRPGLDPLHGLACALQKAFALPGDNLTTLETGLKRSSAGLVDFARAHLKSGQRLLVFVDQFEELFRYRKQAGEEGRAKSTAFVKLLLTATGHSDLVPLAEEAPIHVVLTMRSDYLGSCAQFRGLPEALNDAQYLVPRMSRDQLRETIEGPVALAGAEISEHLVARLLNDTADNPDLLPLLQHALLRVWEQSAAARAASSPIGVEHYEHKNVRGMDQALKLDAEAAFAKLNGDWRKQIAGKVFQRLVEPGSDDEESRRPTRLSELALLCRVTPTDIRHVLESFRQRGFVTFSEEDDPLVDIPHESLIRQWGRLRTWVADEASSASVYRRLEESAAKNRPPFRGPDLAEALRWEETQSPTSAWAARYGSDELSFGRAIAFLRRSEQRRRLARAGLLLGGTLAVALALILYSSYRNAEEQKHVANSLRYVATAQLNWSTQPDRSLLLGIEAVRAFDTFEARNDLLTNLQNSAGLLAFLYQPAPVYDVAFAPDGNTLASAGEDKSVWLWDVATQQPLGQPLEGHTGYVNGVAFSPAGKMLASASDDKTVRLWELATRKSLGEPLVGHTGAVFSVAFSPDGKTLASGSADKTVRLWDVATRQPMGQPLEEHTDYVRSVAFSPDGKTLASASDDKTVRLWDVATRQQLGQPLQGHTGIVYTVAFSPDGKTLASGSEDRTVRLWDVATRQSLGKPLVGHTNAVYSVAFSSDGNTLVSASEENVQLWNLATRQQLEPLERHTKALSSVAFSSDGKTLASGSGEIVRLWDVPAPMPLSKPLEGHTSDVNSVAFSSDGKTLASASADKTVRLWDVTKRQPLGQPLVGHTGAVFSVSFSPDGKTLASASSDQTVRLWDVTTRQPLVQPLQGHKNTVTSVAFSPSGEMLASGSADETVRLWGAVSGQPLGQPLKGHTNYVLSVAFSPDAKMLASASADKTVRLWDVATQQPVGQPLRGHTEEVLGVAFSPDGKTLASASVDGTVRLWDVATRQPLGQPLEEHAAVWSVAFSPDGKTLASARVDQTVRLWDVATRQPLGNPLEGHTNYVLSVAFSPDGKVLASGSADKTVRLWDIDPQSWINRTCAIVNRNLSLDEWRQYIGRDTPYRKTCPSLPVGQGAH